MSKGRAKLSVCGISAANLFLVAASSIFGVYGDGSTGAAPLILSIGAVWVLAFAVRGFILIRKGDHDAAIQLAMRALPYAALTLMIGFSTFAVLAITFGLFF